jgi:hypothetical protein
LSRELLLARRNAVTEAEWLACEDPAPLLQFLSGKVSERKLRLFACACCRRIWPLLPDARSRAAVEAGEQYADGRVTGKQLRLIRVAARRGVSAVRVALRPAARVAASVAGPPLTVPVVAAFTANIARVVGASASAGAATPITASLSAQAAEQAGQCRLLRELLGPLPFWSIPVEPTWLAWRDGVVRKMAQTIHDEARFDDLPILADALEDAGCADADLLAHCRQTEKHVRGCWVVDLLLGKG